MKSISNLLLVLLWRQESSVNPFHDLDKMTAQYDLLIFSR